MVRSTPSTSDSSLTVSRSSLQSHSALVSNSLQAIAQELSEHHTLLSSLIVHPLPQFPNQQVHILEQMLRTKLEPEVDEWVKHGQEMVQTKPKDRALSDRDRNALWQWAPNAANGELRKQKWGADYTLAEKEQGVDKVVTGLKRELAEPPGEVSEDDDEEYEEVTDDDEEEDAMDVVEVRAEAGGQGVEMGVASRRPTAPQMPLESIHKFMMTGKMGP